MYETFFDLKRKPFDLLPNPDFLYPSASHKRALTFLEYGIRDGSGFILLTGEVGSGKTTLIRNLLKKKPATVVLSKVFNTNVAADQLISLINEDFGLAAEGKTKVVMLRELNDFLIKEYGKGRQPVVIIDEAQNLSAESLEEVRLISNLETDQAKLVQVILVGQPELKKTLHRPELLQLRQRISISCHLKPLTAEETEAYILHRLERAGNREAVTFDPEVMPMIHGTSRGIPRLVNIVCDYLMLSAFAAQTRTIDVERARETIDDLDFENQFWTNDQPDAAQKDSRPRFVDARHHNISGLESFLSQVEQRLTVLELEASSHNPDALLTAVERLDSLEGALERRLRRFETAMQGIESRLDRLSVAATKSASPGSNGDGNTPAKAKDVDRETTAAPGSADAPSPDAKKGFFKRMFHSLLLLTLFLAALTLSAGKVQGAPLVGDYGTTELGTGKENGITPSITLGAEFNDNVEETEHDSKEDFVFLARPGLRLDYTAALLELEADYAFSHYNYLRNQRDDRSLHDFDGLATIKLKQDLLHLEVGDTYTQVYRDVTRGEVGSDATLEDQIDQNTFFVSPFFLLDPGDRLKIKTGYRYQDIWYKEEDGIDKHSHAGFAELDYALTPRLDLTGQYTYTDLTAEQRDLDGDDGSYTQHVATAGFVFAYAGNSTIFANAGPSWTAFDDGGSTTDLEWDAGINHDFGRFQVNLLTESSYTEDPDQAAPVRAMTYSGELVLPFTRGQATLLAGYTDFDSEDDENDDREEERYFGALGLNYVPVERLIATLLVMAEERHYPGASTLVVSPSAGLTWELGWDTTVGLWFVQNRSRSEERDGDRYRVNRVLFQVTKEFL